MLTSRHFSVAEFACHTGAIYPPEWIDSRLQPLCAALDAIRDAWGGPIVVVCGYRTAEYNARLRAGSGGVALNSQHIQGTAADIGPVPREPANVSRLCALIGRMLSSGLLPGVGGFGNYPGWAHVDVREKPADGHVARWTGAGFGSEPT
jgi:uncharacterized protein YcbK (DUF882 family)